MSTYARAHVYNVCLAAMSHNPKTLRIGIFQCTCTLNVHWSFSNVYAMSVWQYSWNSPTDFGSIMKTTSLRFSLSLSHYISVYLVLRVGVYMYMCRVFQQHKLPNIMITNICSVVELALSSETKNNFVCVISGVNSDVWQPHAFKKALYFYKIHRVVTHFCHLFTYLTNWMHFFSEKNVI